MKKSNWSIEELQHLYHLPWMELISRAHRIHIEHHLIGETQVCHLVSFKTGGCTEDCSYCAQSAKYQTEVAPLPLMQKQIILQRALQAKASGATRICIGAAWREIRDGKAFDTILEAVKEINAMGLEVCCTLGMLTQDQANRLKRAGLYAYNHNIDTSKNHYHTIITTRSFQERLDTIDRVEKADISVCCGGILGMGEKDSDHIDFIHTLCTREQHPESVPINLLMPMKGTPLQDQPKFPIWDWVRVIATCRITMPQAMIRLSAGRIDRSIEEQALCFFAGANSIFSGEKLLTAINPSFVEDDAMFNILGLKKQAPFVKQCTASKKN